MFLNPWYGQVGAGPASEDAAAAAVVATGAGMEGATATTVELDGGAEASAVLSVTSQHKEEPSPATAGLESCKMDSDKIDGSTASSATAIHQTAAIQKRLKCGWTAHMTLDGRLFYCK